jgi:hypothetical protein
MNTSGFIRYSETPRLDSWQSLQVCCLIYSDFSSFFVSPWASMGFFDAPKKRNKESANPASAA